MFTFPGNCNGVNCKCDISILSFTNIAPALSTTSKPASPFADLLSLPGSRSLGTDESFGVVLSVGGVETWCCVVTAGLADTLGRVPCPAMDTVMCWFVLYLNQKHGYYTTCLFILFHVNIIINVPIATRKKT